MHNRSVRLCYSSETLNCTLQTLNSSLKEQKCWPDNLQTALCYCGKLQLAAQKHQTKLPKRNKQLEHVWLLPVLQEMAGQEEGTFFFHFNLAVIPPSLNALSRHADRTQPLFARMRRKEWRQLWLFKQTSCTFGREALDPELWVVMVSTVVIPSATLAGAASMLIQKDTQERMTMSREGMYIWIR